MLVTLLTPAATYPVTLAEAKAQLRVSHTDQDTMISALIGVACKTVSEMSGRALSEEVWQIALPCVRGDVKLPLSPLIEVTAIEYWDSADINQTLDLAGFYVFQDDDTATIRPKDGVAWPAARRREDAFRFTFTAGYTTVPENLRHAVLLLVDHLFHNTSPVTDGAVAEMPYAVESLIGLSRRNWIVA
jgi:uncharacterized phiE125 gp8 family phage protein